MCSALLAVCVVVGEQGLGRGILRVDGILVALDGGSDLHGQLLAELNAPLVKRVDAPDRALRERDVFVQCDQLTEHLRGERRREDRRGRSVARERAGSNEGTSGPLCLNLLRRLTESERLG